MNVHERGGGQFAEVSPGNTEMLALCIEEENALEILSSALGRRGNLALTRYPQACCASLGSDVACGSMAPGTYCLSSSALLLASPVRATPLSAHAVGSWEAIEHQLIARFDGILGRFRSPIKFLEDADKDVSGWSALNLNARIVAPSQLGSHFQCELVMLWQALTNTVLI
eukprot:1355433-Rhodomonas_salina.6